MSTIDSGVPERTRVSLVSASYFSTLGVPAAMGRAFGAGDERPAGEPAIAVVSHAYWQRRLARDPRSSDAVVRVRSVPITIVGVAPAGFFGEEVGASPDLWVPLTMWASIVPGPRPAEQPGHIVAPHHRQAEARRRRAAGRSETDDHVSPRARRHLRAEARPEDVRREIDESTLRLTPAGTGRLEASRTICPAAPAAPGSRHPRPPHQLRERRKSPPCASRFAPARNRFASCARHEPSAAGSTVDDREPGALDRWARRLVSRSRGWAGKRSCAWSRPTARELPCGRNRSAD